MHVFITRGIITEIQDRFFSADDGGVSGAQAGGKTVRRLRSSTNARYIYTHLHISS
jgi:hypothetical protein